jgi:hypothetical protein
VWLEFESTRYKSLEEASQAMTTCHPDTLQTRIKRRETYTRITEEYVDPIWSDEE